VDNQNLERPGDTIQVSKHQAEELGL
jgi:hypothetical protein